MSTNPYPTPAKLLAAAESVQRAREEVRRIAEEKAADREFEEWLPRIYASMSEAAADGDFHISLTVKCGPLAMDRLVDRMKADGFQAQCNYRDTCGHLVRLYAFIVEWRKIPQAAEG